MWCALRKSGDERSLTVEINKTTLKIQYMRLHAMCARAVRLRERRDSRDEISNQKWIEVFC